MERRRSDDRQRAPGQLCDDSGVLRRHRAAVDGREPRPPHARDQVHADLRVGLHRLEADAAARSRSATAISPTRPTRSCRCPRSSPTGCRPDASTSASSARAQLDRYGNINSTVIGDYEHPTTRLPGAGGAPEIAASAGEVIVIVRQRAAHVRRALRLPHVGRLRRRQGRPRAAWACAGAGPQIVITDLGILRPDPETGELVQTALHPGVTAEQAIAATGWPLRLADDARGHRSTDGERARRARGAASRMKPFTYDALAGRTVFAVGALSRVGDELARSGPTRVFLIVDAQAKRVRRLAGRRPRRARREPVARGRAARAVRARRTGAGRGHRRAGRRRGVPRRRIVDRPRQGDRADPRPADPRRADHLRGQRADADLRAHRRSSQADRAAT